MTLPERKADREELITRRKDLDTKREKSGAGIELGRNPQKEKKKCG